MGNKKPKINIFKDILHNVITFFFFFFVYSTADLTLVYDTRAEFVGPAGATEVAVKYNA